MTVNNAGSVLFYIMPSFLLISFLSLSFPSSSLTFSYHLTYCFISPSTPIILPLPRSSSSPPPQFPNSVSLAPVSSLLLKRRSNRLIAVSRHLPARGKSKIYLQTQSRSEWWKLWYCMNKEKQVLCDSCQPIIAYCSVSPLNIITRYQTADKSFGSIAAV